MQQSTVPNKRQIKQRIERAMCATHALRDRPNLSAVDLEAAWSEVDGIRDDLNRL
jgi:hypothetical protein